MASFWQQMPFIRIIIPFILGIIYAAKTAIYTSEHLIILFGTGLSLFVFKKISHAILPNFKEGIFLNYGFFMLGIICQSNQNYLLHYKHYSESNQAYLCVQLTENPRKNNFGYKAEALVLYGLNGNQTKNEVSGKLLVNFKDTQNNIIPVYGDQIIIKSSFQEFSLPKNPGAFNYKNYLAQKGIFYQVFVPTNGFVFSGLNQGNYFIKKVIRLQNYIKEVLQKNIHNPGEIAIAEALLYGYDKDISDEVTTAYSKTGTLHVLAVSGMHVGMIFMLLSLLLKPLEKRQKGKLVVALLNLFGIWAYSLICGFSPSILRATVMFSFVIIGKQIQRGGNPFNSLAASAMLLLMVNPLLIYNVGFQLSYAAVLGILGFYPKLYLLVSFRYNWADEIWKIIAVSIAAQVLTLPLSIYYFHQIPNYFLMANLVIIPLSSIIIYLGIALLFISPFPILAIWLGKLIGGLIQLLNAIAIWIADLPGAYIDQLNWNEITLVLVYAIILFIILYFSLRDLIYFRIGLLIILLIQLNQINRNMVWNKQKQLTIYCIKKGFVMEFTQQKESIIYSNIGQLNGSKIFQQVVNPNQLLQGIANTSIHEIDTGNIYLAIAPNYHVFLVQTNQIPTHQNIDIMVLSGNKYQNIKHLIMHNHIKQFVLNQDILPKKRQAIKKILTKCQIPFYDIKENGAFELSL